MLPFKYPGRDPSPELAAHNGKVDSGSLGTSGGVGVALDIWRDNVHLFRSYDPQTQAESLDSWCRRNYPAIENPDYQACPMGTDGAVGGVEHYPVPTLAALNNRFTYSTIPDLLRAALATAQFPAPPENLGIVINANALRQRVFASANDWIKVGVFDPSNRVYLRAIVGPSIVKTEEPMATYIGEIKSRPRSTIESNMEERTVEFEAPYVDLKDAAARRPVTKEGKKVAGLTGVHSVVVAHSNAHMVHKLTAHAFDFTITRARAPEAATAATQAGGLDIAH